MARVCRIVGITPVTRAGMIFVRGLWQLYRNPVPPRAASWYFCTYQEEKMVAEWAIETTVKLSKRYTVTMTFGPSGSTCEWVRICRRLTNGHALAALGRL